MKRVLAWSSEYVKNVTRRVEENLSSKYQQDPLEYIDEEGNVSIDKDNDIDSAIETVLELDELGGIIATEDFDSLAEGVHEWLDFNLFEQASDYIKETYNDTVEYNKNPLRYHGMRESDFL
jgi:hypothetical protein